MKASDLGRAAELTADLARLEAEIRKINFAVFDIAVERRGGAQSSFYWESASAVFDMDKLEIQRIARQAVLDLKAAAVREIREKLAALGVDFEDAAPQALAAE
jgi:hypothetical protein